MCTATETIRKGIDIFPLKSYHKIVVACSGGKDSIVGVLDLLEQGVEPERIELMHHRIDGMGKKRFDWAITDSYVQAFARHVGIKLRFSWKDGGFEGELLRDEALSKGVYYEDGDGTVQYVPPAKPGTYCKECRAIFLGDEKRCLECNTLRKGYNTRLKYPMVIADLSRRWCSAYLKIDIFKRVLCNDPRFEEGNFLLITGERRQESTPRSKMVAAENHRSSNKRRIVHQYRSVLEWREEQVWETMKRHGIVPHPCYRLGFARCSCMFCIFGDEHQWATARKLAPDRFAWHSQNEKRFGLTLLHDQSLEQCADEGKVFEAADNPELAALAMSEHYPQDQIYVPPSEWKYPAGSFKRQGGPV